MKFILTEGSINLEEFSEGIYLIQLSGETVDKTVKIVRE